MKNNDWKERLNVVYSTNPDYQYENIGEEETETLPKNQQKLRVSMEKKGRGGKTVTLVRGFVGTEEDLKDLGKLLKTKCGVRLYQGWRNHHPRRLQATHHRLAESGRLYSGEINEKRVDASSDTPTLFYIKSLYYSARKVKRLNSVIFNSGSAAFNTSLTVFLPSKISS